MTSKSCDNNSVDDNAMSMVLWHTKNLLLVSRVHTYVIVCTLTDIDYHDT